MGSTQKLLTVREVADMFGVAVSSVWRWVTKGVLPAPVKFGGRTRWVEAEILEVIKRAKADRGSGGRTKPTRAHVKGKGEEGETDKPKRKKKRRVRLDDAKPPRT